MTSKLRRKFLLRKPRRHSYLFKVRHVEKREMFRIGGDMHENYKKVVILQEKIALAKRNNDIETLKNLVGELLASEEARIIAVHRVVSNTGVRSPGLSKGSFKTNTDYQAMIERLEDIHNNPQNYKASPLDRLYIPKAKGGVRPISIPSYTDRCLQALYRLAASPIGEETADKYSYGFRPLRTIHMAAGKTLGNLTNPLANYTCVVEVDVKGCFNNISQDSIYGVMRDIIPYDILYQWLNCGYLEREQDEVTPTDKGVPQGGVISPLLANMVLDGLDAYVRAGIDSQNFGRKGGTLVRFADDMLYFCTSYEAAVYAKKLINEFLNLHGLELNDSKTKITDLNLETFKFVGFNFCRASRRNQKTLTATVKVPQKAIQNIRKSIELVRYSTYSMGQFIDKANPIIKGWGNAYRYAHDFRYIIKSLNYWIWKQYYAKAYSIVKKVHDKSNHTDINAKVMDGYFAVYKSFSTWPTVARRKGKIKTLASLTEIPSQNPTFPKTAAKNAYILEERKILENWMQKNSYGLRAKVLNRSKFCCASCGCSYETFPSFLELHHVLPRLYGGKDGAQNLVALCKEPCHLEISVALQQKDKNKIKKLCDRGLLILPTEILKRFVDQDSSSTPLYKVEEGEYL